MFLGLNLGCERQKETIQGKISKKSGMICDFEDSKLWGISHTLDLHRLS